MTRTGKRERHIEKQTVVDELRDVKSKQALRPSASILLLLLNQWSVFERFFLPMNRRSMKPRPARADVILDKAFQDYDLAFRDRKHECYHAPFADIFPV
jgi:hypothetical protein